MQYHETDDETKAEAFVENPFCTFRTLIHDDDKSRKYPPHTHTHTLTRDDGSKKRKEVSNPAVNEHCI